jgi:farnesyl-diphosphate farnesyltransferase
MKDQMQIVQARAFTREILPQVSRTFDLAIRFLPRNLGNPVGLAYLLCRIADTFEDSAVLGHNQRQLMLQKYAELLDSPGNYNSALINEIKGAFEPGTQGISFEKAKTSSFPDHLPSLELVRNIDKVLIAVDAVPGDFRRHIFPRVQEMSLGMARYTTLASGDHDKVNYLDDEADWDNYCYYVAGTVGHMLTDIFSDYAGFSDNMRDRLHPLGRSFGLGLQKVNVLKDAVIDTSRGVCFLPRTFIERYGISFEGASIIRLKGDIAGLVLNVVDICRRHFEDSLEYIRMIPLKYPGLRMFLIVPMMLAASTLRLISEYPHRLVEKGDMKLGRGEVWSLVRKAFFLRFSNRLLTYSFARTFPAPAN